MSRSPLTGPWGARAARVAGAFVATAVLVAAGPGTTDLRAQQQQAQPAVQEDPLFQALFPPELIMQHRRAIGLTDEQRDAISQMIQQLQGRVVRLQWELLDEMQQLTEIMSAPRVELDRALDQLNDVLDTEQEIKQAHLEMLVRIKNLLTPEQQAMLERLREGGAG
jgi:Spy/CpxP family protein refolding chaperone